LIAGEHTPKPARAIVDELAHILPEAHLRVVRRAGHMSPLTHPSEISALVTDHIDRVEMIDDCGTPSVSDARGKRRSIA
jgi:pimeloyl-ACP methyl ester carboxylesterase